MKTAAASGRSWRAALVALSLAFWIHVYHHFAPLDSYLPPSAVHDVEKHFSENYYEARALFRDRVRAASGRLHTLPLEHLSHLDLTIDIAVFPAADDKAVIHISGTHGVEGFAGSAVQSALLERLGNSSEVTVDSPTLIFVHALNPYGMAMLRRFNEHNVDLNRNFLTPEGFQERFRKDPNAYGYVDLLDALNPTNPTKRFAWFDSIFAIARHAFRHGLVSIKMATVAGNVHFPKTIFYGGNEMEPSVRLLHQFLQSHLNFDTLESVGVIDVHTGIGPPGFDTLLLDGAADPSTAQGIFHGRQPVVSGDTSDPASNGYRGTTGLMCGGFAWLLPERVKKVCLTQEFGTIPGVLVLKALIQENAMFHHAPSRRLPYAEALRDAFYVHQSVQWKTDVVSRGVTVWEELEAHVAGEGAADEE